MLIVGRGGTRRCYSGVLLLLKGIHVRDEHRSVSHSTTVMNMAFLQI